jgi:hypothetical protein
MYSAQRLREMLLGQKMPSAAKTCRKIFKNWNFPGNASEQRRARVRRAIVARLSEAMAGRCIPRYQSEGSALSATFFNLVHPGSLWVRANGGILRGIAAVSNDGHKERSWG